MSWHTFTLRTDLDEEHLTVFTTAKLTWQPLTPEDPDGAQIATLWGDPASGTYAAVVRSAAESYSFVRRA